MPAKNREYIKQEIINGVIYDISPSADYRHGIINGNIYHKIKYSLQGTTQGRYLTGGVPPVRFSM